MNQASGRPPAVGHIPTSRIMYADEDLIPISALQHHMFCPRQCALIHVDGLWAENRLTVHGNILHERSDTPGSHTGRWPASSDLTASTPGVRIVRAMPLVSRVLGLSGKADQVEIPHDAQAGSPPKPVEHKRGTPKRLDHDRVQLAAQALCLEEMFGVRVPVGELFYHAVRRRERVEIDQRLRDLVKRVVDEVRANLAANHVPSADLQRKCKSCSLLHLCMPGGTGPSRSPARYLSRSLSTSLASSTEAAS